MRIDSSSASGPFFQHSLFPSLFVGRRRRGLGFVGRHARFQNQTDQILRLGPFPAVAAAPSAAFTSLSPPVARLIREGKSARVVGLKGEKGGNVRLFFLPTHVWRAVISALWNARAPRVLFLESVLNRVE